MSEEEIRQEARERYVEGDNNVAVDDGAAVIEISNGYWVAAFVFVPKEEA